MKPSQLSSFSPADSLQVARTLAQSGQTLSPSMAKSLGANIPANQPLDTIPTVASSVPLSCFNNTNPATLANLIGSMDLGNMSPFRKGFMASKVIQK